MIVFRGAYREKRMRQPAVGGEGAAEPAPERGAQRLVIGEGRMMDRHQRPPIGHKAADRGAYGSVLKRVFPPAVEVHHQRCRRIEGSFFGPSERKGLDVEFRSFFKRAGFRDHGFQRAYAREELMHAVPLTGSCAKDYDPGLIVFGKPGRERDQQHEG